MTDLTEQWKKGELETNKYYYVRDMSYISPAKLGKYDNQLYFSGNEVGYGYEENKELEILAPVPSYEEWDKLNNACHELEKENACLTVDIVKLKELLKLARGLMNCTKDWACTEATENIIAKINQALGEDE